MPTARRLFFVFAAVGALWAGLFVAPVVGAAPLDREVVRAGVSVARPPNIVYILVDDLSDFTMTPYGATAVTSRQGHFGNVPLAMPNIDRLADGGVRCTQAYVYPICEPSRVAILTGMHNGRNFIAPKAIHASQITVSDVFKRAGYATGMFGKWKQTRGTPEHPAETYIDRFGWDDWLCFDVTGEGSRFLDPVLWENGQPRHYTEDDRDPQTGRRWYGPDVCNRAALRFIDENKDRPFFLYYPMILVHDEHTPTPDTVPASAYDNFDLTADYPDGAMQGDARQYFPDMLAYMDKLIGQVVDRLDELGLRDNTLIVLQGDNGTKAVFAAVRPAGADIAGGKGHSRFTGERVGLIFSQPGTVPAGTTDAPRVYRGLVDAVDIYPTLAHAAGIAVPNADRIDGVSVWPQVAGSAAEPRRRAIYKWYNGNRTIRDLDRKIEFAHTADFKRYAPHGVFPEGRFFDLRIDPWERAGAFGENAGWENDYHHGLDVTRLNAEQRAAYRMLGDVLKQKRYVAVESLTIGGVPAGGRGLELRLSVGDAHALACAVAPANATRNNVVWESSDPAVASVNKFGEVTAHAAGTVEIVVYAWDDADPVANGKAPAYRRDGLSDRLRVTIAP